MADCFLFHVYSLRAQSSETSAIIFKLEPVIFQPSAKYSVIDSLTQLFSHLLAQSFCQAYANVVYVHTKQRMR